MNKIIRGLILLILISIRKIESLRDDLEMVKSEQQLLRSMFTTKVDRFNHVSGRHEYAETLRSELERLERETGVK